MKYTEEKLAAAPYRRRLVDELDNYIKAEREKCDERRRAFFAPDTSSAEAYAASTERLRGELKAMLGRPLTDYPTDVPTNAERVFVADEGDHTIERLWVEVAPGLYSYGLLFVPKGEGKHPYVSVFHGGAGTCEIVSSIYWSANYRDLLQRIRKKTNAIMYAPQIMLWADEYNTCPEEKSDNIGHDLKLKQIGSSMAALEVYKIMRTVDWICENLPVDRDRMGVAGLSYGGFYTLMNAAIDTRYKAALSSGIFNNRYLHPRCDWVWFDSGSKFLDGEVAKLVCPRALCVELGEKDNLFGSEEFVKLSAEVAETYAAVGIADRFRSKLHPGDHQVCDTDENIDWFVEKLMG